MNFDNLHQILRSLYEQMMPLCGDMAGVAKGIAGLGALFYVAYRCLAVAGESRTDRRVPHAPPLCDRLVHHVLSDGGTGYDKQHHVARRTGYGKDAGGGNAGHEPIP
ncbi:hypothetical protein KGMB02408_41680 [Bacteroides faecalis]|uniref:Conjugative transposon TraJ C-terminal domain-containing protein n=1 Tax=Bacteroides faecalis TaxID=2447885 RepID=A0A401M0F0_9BACE|nr:hypothetical protein KGMB02408_41680 [Bacteroides faecalis]